MYLAAWTLINDQQEKYLKYLCKGHRKGIDHLY